MSINVYLKGEEVKKIQGFHEKTKGHRGQEWTEYYLPGVKLHQDKGRWYTTLLYDTDKIPSVILDIVEEISLLETIPRFPARESGFYHLESAKGEVRNHDQHKSVYLISQNMEDLRELFRRIQIGSIRPEESYEGEQSGLSRSELEAELAREKKYSAELAEGINNQCAEILESQKKIVAGSLALKREITIFKNRIEKERWPFCTKKRIAGEIEKVLNQL